MNKEWVDRENRKLKESMTQEHDYIVQALTNTDLLPEDKKMDILKDFEDEDFVSAGMRLYLYGINTIDDGYEETEIYKFCKEISDRITDYGDKNYRSSDHAYDDYLDSEPKEFDGDIIITDPCYLIREDSEWNSFDYLNDEYMKIQGFQNYMLRSTLYGDWSCTTFDLNTGGAIGEFCADAGMVGVFLLDEVLRYNPDFNLHVKSPWTTTLIKDFKGTVQFVVLREEGFYEEDDDFHKRGDTWVDYSVEVIGHGINKVTGDPISFVGRQTGL